MNKDIRNPNHTINKLDLTLLSIKYRIHILLKLHQNYYKNDYVYTGNVANILYYYNFYYNYKWNLIFKIVNHCTPAT